ncbi:MAG: hypothetical protein AAGH64_00740 [Planctomycetota bacterium]
MTTLVRRQTRRALFALVCVGAVAFGPGGCASSGAGAGAPGDASPEEFAKWRAERLAQAQKLAERAEREDDLAEKEALLRDAVDLFPQHSAFWTNLGAVLAARNDYASAAEAFGLASELDPTDPRPAYNHGALYVRRYWYQPAIPHFEQALGRDPNYLNAIRGLARTRVVLRDFDSDLVDLLDRAVLLESDERWLAYFQRQRVAVRAEMDRTGIEDE